MEKVLSEKLGKILKIEPTKLQELDTPEKAVEIDALLAQHKVFKNGEFESVLNNYKDSIKPGIIEEAKKNTEKDTHISIQEKIKTKYGVNLEHGKDYQKTTELIEKIVELKGKPTGDPTADAKRVTELEKQIVDLNTNFKTKESEFQTKSEKKYFDSLVNSELNNIKARLDVDDDKKQGQAEFLKYKFDSLYSIKEDETGQVLVIDKKGEVLKSGVDNQFKPLSLSDVVNSIASTFSKIKTVVLPAGRGDNNAGVNNNSGGNAIDWTLYNDWDSFRKNNQVGKTLTAGSKEANELYAQFIKAKGL
jgi:hypothetical protein